MKDKPGAPQPFRAVAHYGSSLSLKSLANDGIANPAKELKRLDCTGGGSLISLHDHPELTQLRRRSPSLPPIYNKEQGHYVCQDHQRDFGIEGLCCHPHKTDKHHRRRSGDRHEDLKDNRYALHGEERGGETSGYASDSIDVPVVASARILPDCKQPGIEMSEKTWQNPYYTTSESSLPPSRRLSDGRIGELNRPRWGGIWGQETARGDPPAPSWLARLGHTSQVLVINHDSASSPDSSTTGSTGSELTKSYIRGQNLPVDADIIQEREARRQKALELQNAIKQQLEEKDRKRREDRERRLREERLEEERIKREQEKERERFEEEQRRQKEKEHAKLKQAEAMREVLQAAERLAKEEKRNRWKREDGETDRFTTQAKPEPKEPSPKADDQYTNVQNQQPSITKEEKDSSNQASEQKNKEFLEASEQTTPDIKSIQVPISKDIAIVLSGRLEDTDALRGPNLPLLNLLVSPSPRGFDAASSNLSLGVQSLVRSPAIGISPGIVENRLLTPSKYRSTCGRDFGTQTDVESDVQELREKMQDSSLKEHAIKERKDAANTSRRDVEKTANGGTGEDSPMKSLHRSKSQPRTSIESRPRWNANRPGTRYRTQSEKDPHYQRRMRLRRRQVESSDERSRSPSPDRRKSSNTKSKVRNVSRRKAKIDHYDADLSMDSLNSIIPLRIDKNGRVNVEDNKCLQSIQKNQSENSSPNEIDGVPPDDTEDPSVWCGQEILSKLTSLKNGLLVKQMEWDSERCLVSPAASEFY